MQRFSTLCAFLVLLITGCQTISAPQPTWTHPAPPVADIGVQPAMLIALVRGAFFVDGEEHTGRELPLQRRITPMNISFRGDDFGIRPLVEAHAAELTRISGVPHQFIEPSGRIRAGDVVFFVRSSTEVANVFRQRTGINDTICHAMRYRKSPSERHLQVSSEIWMSRDLPERWQHCIVEEMAHALGLSGDGRLALPSAFGTAPFGELSAMTPTDQAALWIVYHPDLRPGMTWSEAEPIVERIVIETWGG